MQGMSERQYAAHVGQLRGEIQNAMATGHLVLHEMRTDLDHRADCVGTYSVALDLGIARRMNIAIAILIALAVAGLPLVFGWFWTDGPIAPNGRGWPRSSLQIPNIFVAGMVADLPEPARRYFAYAIQPGTPLRPVVEIQMTGQFSLGTKDDPRYRPMEARQILATPEGFVWEMRTRGGMPLSGSDSGRWTRFRIFALIPVARVGGDPDHARSAFGRYVAEAVIWAPAALMPGPGVTWEAVDDDTARVTVRHGDL